MQGTLGVWAEPFTKLRLNKIFNLYQDPFERADITSNTFWDWQLNHVGSAYGMIQDVVVFAETFKEFPPRSIPPSFSPYTIMDEVLAGIKAKAFIEKNMMPKEGTNEDAKPAKKK